MNASQRKPGPAEMARLKTHIAADPRYLGKEWLVRDVHYVCGAWSDGPNPPRIAATPADATCKVCTRLFPLGQGYA